MTRTYRVLCRTCGGVGKILDPARDGNTTALNYIVCPVCSGRKTQIITEQTNDIIGEDHISKSPLFDER